MNLFAENRIFLNQSFASSDELFDFVGKQMEGLGMAKAGFGDSLKRRESSYPTGLPGLTADIALPHTDPEFIVEPFIAVVSTKEGVPFTQPPNLLTLFIVKNLFFSNKKLHSFHSGNISRSTNLPLMFVLEISSKTFCFVAGLRVFRTFIEKKVFKKN